MREKMKKADEVMMLIGGVLIFGASFVAFAGFLFGFFMHGVGGVIGEITAWGLLQWWFRIDFLGACILAGWVLVIPAFNGFWSKELEGLKRISARKPPPDRKQEVSRELLEKYVPRSQVKNPLP